MGACFRFVGKGVENLQNIYLYLHREKFATANS